ncbi:hypothetical protein [Rhodomicrobium lacus]|uniref:hypothetical protein n=1 Tax=Rhodomicrobium lacus TaxID=2498452 RepID=UPI000F8C6DC2|nr:hypothetical protein [Rhodomicrobium lacus]
MKLKLRSSDIQHRHDITLPGAWTGETIDVALEGGLRGNLETIMQTDANTWHLRWLCEESSLNGRTFELARMISTIHGPHQQPDWNCRLLLAD